MIRSIATALNLSVLDLWSEKVMTACLILGIAAVVTPLLVLGSIKVGFVDRLKEDLIKDPTYRELQPGDAEVKSEALFAALNESRAVEFFAPTVMMVPREVVIRKSGSTDRFEGRLIPTGDGDPLVARSGLERLGITEIVMSEDLSEASSVGIGDEIDVLVFRTLRDQRERAETTLTVVGTFPAELTKTPTIVASPILDSEVEGWRAGIPAPRLGWRGVETNMRESYDQIHIATSRPLTQFALDALEARLGATSIEQVSWPDYLSGIGLEDLENANQLPGAARSHYRLARQNGRFVGSDLEAVSEIIDEPDIFVSGVSPIASISGNGLAGNLSFADFRLLGQPCRPYCLDPENANLNLDGFVVSGVDAVDRVSIDVEFTNDLNLPLRPLAQLKLPEGSFLSDWRLGGLLGRQNETKIGYDSAANRFFEETTGYRGFRIIANDLNSVVEVADLVRDFGYTVRSSDDAIRRLQKLDQGLNILVAVVAGVAMAGGFLVLGINFFANVQRKTLSFATLRLLGMRKTTIFVHPFFQSLIIVAAGFGISMIFFFLVQAYVNSTIASELGFGGSLSTLRPEHFLIAFLIVLVGAVASCLISAFYVVQVDAAIALKEGNV